MMLITPTLSSWLGAFFSPPSRAFPTKEYSFQICKLPPYYPISQLQLLKSRVSDSMADYSNLFAVLIVLFSISSGCLNLMIGLLISISSIFFCLISTPLTLRMPLPHHECADIYSRNVCGCRSAAKSCRTLWDPNSSVLHYFLEFAQIHVHECLASE